MKHFIFDAFSSLNSIQGSFVAEEYSKVGNQPFYMRMQTDKQTNKQTYKQTDKQTNDIDVECANVPERGVSLAPHNP